MAQDGTSELGEESLDEIEPRAVLGSEGKFEASDRSSGEPSSGFSRDVRGMIVEDQLDRSVRRIGGVEKPEEFDELSTAVAILTSQCSFAFLPRTPRYVKHSPVEPRSPSAPLTRSSNEQLSWRHLFIERRLVPCDLYWPPL